MPWHQLTLKWLLKAELLNTRLLLLAVPIIACAYAISLVSDLDIAISQQQHVR